MPLNVIDYTFDIGRAHCKQYKTDVLPVVIPLVFYHGRRPYVGPTDIFELFGAQKELAKEVMFKPFHLVDLAQIEDDIIETWPVLGTMAFLMKHIYDKNLRVHLERIAALLKQVAKRKLRGYIENAINYLLKAGQVDDSSGFTAELIAKINDDNVEGNTMTIAEGLRIEGEKRILTKLTKNLDGNITGDDPMTIAEGLMAKGQLKKQKQMALNALKHGLNIELIAQLTELSQTEIETLKLEGDY